MRRRTYLPLIVIGAMLSASVCHALEFKNPYQGAQDYEKDSPFLQDVPEKAHLVLRSIMLQAKTSSKGCVWAKVKNKVFEKTYTHRGNICGAGQIARLRAAIAPLAPKLAPGAIAAWKTDLDGDREPELIITYHHTAEDNYPFLTLWTLKFTEGKYHPTYIGPFLDGVLRVIRSFPDGGSPKLFVRHQSCYECCPWVYISIIDPLFGRDGAFYLFNYTDQEDGFSEQFEFVLPGEGHSVEAKVETRIPKTPPTEGPHLMQKFRLTETGETEWWMFRCEGFRCGSHMVKARKLDPDLHRIWTKAGRL